MTHFGYARVSTADQNLDRQIRLLEQAGVHTENIFQEKISGGKKERPKLQRLLETIKSGDQITVSDLTRISRSSRDLFELVDLITSKGAVLKSIKDTWLDTSSNSPYSQFLLTVMAGVSQLERDLINERIREGVAIAKEKGKYRGRLRKYTERHAGLNHAIELYKTGSYTVNQICEITKVGRSTLYTKLKEMELTGG